MHGICAKVHALTSDGGAILFHAAREEYRIRAAMLTRYRMDLSKPDNLEKENLGGAGDENVSVKHYQIIAFATKGKTPRIFHRLRIDPPLSADYKHAR